MRSIHNQIYLSKSFVFLSISINTLLIIAGYFYHLDFLLGLLIALPLLTLAIINWKKNSRNRTGKHVSILYQPGNVKLKGEDNFHLCIAYNDTVKNAALIGNHQCVKPYLAKMLSVSMKGGAGSMEISLPENAGNGSLYNSEDFLTTRILSDEDRIWQIKPGYTGCRTKAGQFSAEAFKNNAARQDIKMIEVDLTGSENDLPVQIASARLFRHREEFKQRKNVYFGFQGFYNADGMVDFLTLLRKLSGKALGLRISISDKKEFYRICHIFRITHFFPDFITVEGLEEPDNFIVGKTTHEPNLPLYESLQFVSETLKLYGLDQQIKIIASTKSVSPFEILKLKAFGSDVVSLELPGYFADPPDNNVSMVQLPSLNNYLSVFHDRMMGSTNQLMEVCGFNNINNISLPALLRVVDIDNGQQFGLKAASY